MGSIPAGLLVLAIVIVVAAFVAQPFFASRGDEEMQRAGRRTAALLRQRADLLAERNRIYAAICDLDFDHRTNKIADDDYVLQRHALVAAGVEVLQRLDALPLPDESPETDPIEAAVLALGRGGDVAAALYGVEETGNSFCPQCGKPVRAGDRFCGGCGTRL